MQETRAKRRTTAEIVMALRTCECNCLDFNSVNIRDESEVLCAVDITNSSDIFLSVIAKEYLN